MKCTPLVKIIQNIQLYEIYEYTKHINIQKYEYTKHINIQIIQSIENMY